MTATPASNRPSAEIVADQLRTAIQHGQYAPGDRLVERTLARELGVSHIPVREALARLEEERFVVSEPRRSARVAELSPTLLQEISSLRIVLEQLVARRVQERFTDAAAASLRAIVDEMTAAAADGRRADVFELDCRFHETLWRLADHSILLEVSGQLRGRINRFLLAAIESLADDALIAHAETHHELVDALAGGDRGAAQRATRRHITVALARIQHEGKG